MNKTAIEHLFAIIIVRYTAFRCFTEYKFCLCFVNQKPHMHFILSSSASIMLCANVTWLCVWKLFLQLPFFTSILTMDVCECALNMKMAMIFCLISSYLQLYTIHNNETQYLFRKLSSIHFEY